MSEPTDGDQWDTSIDVVPTYEQIQGEMIRQMGGQTEIPDHPLFTAENALERYAHQADDLAAAGDYVALGVGLGRLRGLRQALSALERHVEDHVAELLPHKRVEVEGLVMERRSSTTRKSWQSEELLRHLVGDQLVNPDTGENMYRTLLDCLPITGSLGWRVKALQQRGIDVEDWCEETPGRTGVQVYTPKEEDDG